MMTIVKDPLTISLIAQRTFNHNLLFSLVEAGVLNQGQAGAIAGKTSNDLREIGVAPSEKNVSRAVVAGL